MFDIFANYLSGNVSLTNKELGLVQSLSVQEKVPKQSFILREGDVSDSMIFVANGLLRLYKTDADGDEHIIRFANEYHWINDRESYATGKPSQFNIDAIEHSEVLVWTKNDFYCLMKELPALREFMKALGARKQIANQNRIYASISHSAEERYNQFVEHYPTVFNRVPLHMVASYLGVSRETLSRIRRRALKK